MIYVTGKEKSNSEMLLKTYNRKLDQTRFLKRLKSKRHFLKKCEKARREKNKAIMRQRYRREHGLI